jgi:hypothetical protein
MEPAWTPDGQNILYVTEDKGSNDIRIISAAGGDPIELTVDTAHHEMSPTVSPDGKRFAFVQFDGGVPTLYTADINGGRASAWHKVSVTSRKSVKPTGKVRIRVLVLTARCCRRIYVDASDGRHLRRTAFDRSMMVFDRHSSICPRPIPIPVPAGKTQSAICGGRSCKRDSRCPAGARRRRRFSSHDLPSAFSRLGTAESHVHDLQASGIARVVLPPARRGGSEHARAHSHGRHAHHGPLGGSAGKRRRLTPTHIPYTRKNSAAASVTSG